MNSEQGQTGRAVKRLTPVRLPARAPSSCMQRMQGTTRRPMCDDGLCVPTRPAQICIGSKAPFCQMYQVVDESRVQEHARGPLSECGRLCPHAPEKLESRMLVGQAALTTTSACSQTRAKWRSPLPRQRATCRRASWGWEAPAAAAGRVALRRARRRPPSWYVFGVRSEAPVGRPRRPRSATPQPSTLAPPARLDRPPGDRHRTECPSRASQ